MRTRKTPEDIADMVEHSINEAKPEIKTRRGLGNEVELKVGRSKFIVIVKKPKPERNKAA